MATILIDALVGAITTQAFIEHTGQDLKDEEEEEMTVTATSPSPYPNLIEVGCLTLSTNPILAPPSGLVISGQPGPSGPTPLVHNATDKHTSAEDSHLKRARDGGI